VLRASLEPVDGRRFSGRPVVAFAGIGRPKKFFATLRRLGATLAAARAFPDHHFFRAGELAALRRDAERTGAPLVTTAKDWVRLPPNQRDGVAVLTVELRWRDEGALNALLAPLIDRIGDGGRAARA
jgi:tetraacyldisaccharide 4'-kinase